jgi:glycosyltransferase involved in cell wall biosynthesis
MGYLVHGLPKYLARLGVEVHVLTTDLPSYYYLNDFNQTYGKFLETTSVSAGTVEKYDGFTLHVVPHKKLFGYVYMANLLDKLKEINPDIVQLVSTIGLIPLNAAFTKLFMKYELFTGSHTAASMFPLFKKQKSILDKEQIKSFITRTIPGRIISFATNKCYSVTSDAGEIAWRFFGVEKHKVEVMHLGVDTDFFFPINSELLMKERKDIRQILGFAEEDILCIYTGKLTETKNAIIIAQAIEKLRTKGKTFSALFIGDGIQKESIKQYPFCKVLDFMPFSELGVYYRASDIGIWPTTESTSMLDAAACGLPLIVSDGIVYRQHIDGNGLIYKMNNLDDLVNTLLSLNEKEYRKTLGNLGFEKMKTYFTWENVAKRRLRDYEASLTY